MCSSSARISFNEREAIVAAAWSGTVQAPQKLRASATVRESFDLSRWLLLSLAARGVEFQPGYAEHLELRRNDEAYLDEPFRLKPEFGCSGPRWRLTPESIEHEAPNSATLP